MSPHTSEPGCSLTRQYACYLDTMRQLYADYAATSGLAQQQVFIQMIHAFMQQLCSYPPATYVITANLFHKDICRPINGVVKADQLDEASVWQELDEFVVTRELNQHLRQFFSTYCDSIDHRHDADVSGKIGVWVSGFFGSGKSHFLKVLSYLLQNHSHTHGVQSKQALKFFETKIKDALLFGDIQRAVASNTDVILFNIDTEVTQALRRAQKKA
jgi:hypothetical protein